MVIISFDPTLSKNTLLPLSALAIDLSEFYGHGLFISCCSVHFLMSFIDFHIMLFSSFSYTFHRHIQRDLEPTIPIWVPKLGAF